jgi:hypothetical protein
VPKGAQYQRMRFMVMQKTMHRLPDQNSASDAKNCLPRLAAQGCGNRCPAMEAVEHGNASHAIRLP